MKYIKLFEELIKPDVNILIDVSSSMHVQEHQILKALKPIHFEKYNKIRLIQFTYEVEKYDTVRTLDEIKKALVFGGFVTRIQPAINFLIKNHLENNKTYIISSDFYLNDNPDYSKLSNYKNIIIDDDSDDDSEDVFPEELDYDERDEITNYNL